MALSMASLNSTKSGAFVARKATPQDARAEYKRLYGVGHEAILKMPAGTRPRSRRQLVIPWALRRPSVHCRGLGGS